VSLSGILKGKEKGKEKQCFTKEDLATMFQQVYLDDPKGGFAGSGACDPRSFATFSFLQSASL